MSTINSCNETYKSTQISVMEIFISKIQFNTRFFNNNFCHLNARKYIFFYVHGLDIYMVVSNMLCNQFVCVCSVHVWILSMHKKNADSSPRVHLFHVFFFPVCFVYFCPDLEVLVWTVRQTVPSQVTVAPKHLSAAATAVGLDVCMGEKVSFQVTSLIKGSSACGAFVGRLLFRFKASKGLFLSIISHFDHEYLFQNDNSCRFARFNMFCICT